MNTIREIQALNKREIENGVPTSASWHTDYRDTAYVYIGGLSFDLTEGDIITIFSEFGEPVWLKLVRDKETGKSKGFAFLKYEDQRSTDLAVDNLGGATVDGRVLKVDHSRYKKRDDEDDEKFNIAVTVGTANPAEGRETNRDTDESTYSSGPEQRKRKAPRDAVTQEHEEEDPMRDYLAQERRERHHTHRSNREKRSGDHKHRHHHHHRRHRHHSSKDD